MTELTNSEVAQLIGAFLSEAEVGKVMSHIGQGGSLLIKYDGKRSDENWTVVLSDGLMNDDFFRQDGASVLELLKKGASEITG